MTDGEVLKLIEKFRAGRRTFNQFCNAFKLSEGSFRKHCRRVLGDEEWSKLLAQKKPKSTQYALGRSFEYRVHKYFELHDFPVVIRSSGSKGMYDLCAVKNGSTFLIQCKRSGGISKKKANEAFSTAVEAGAVFVIAENPTGSKLQLWLVEGPCGTEGWLRRLDCDTMAA